MIYQFNTKDRLTYSEHRTFYVGSFDLHEPLTTKTLHERLFESEPIKGYSHMGAARACIELTTPYTGSPAIGDYFVVWSYEDDIFARVIAMPTKLTGAGLFTLEYDHFGDKLMSIRLDDIRDIIEDTDDNELIKSILHTSSYYENIGSYVRNLKTKLLEQSTEKSKELTGANST